MYLSLGDEPDLNFRSEKFFPDGNGQATVKLSS